MLFKIEFNGSFRTLVLIDHVMEEKSYLLSVPSTFITLQGTYQVECVGATHVICCMK